MSIWMAGIDYNRAGVDIRACFAFTKHEMDEAYRLLSETKGVLGSILVSTCNRTELWLSTADSASVHAGELLCRLKGVSEEAYRPYIFTLTESEAEDHLFRLASGLESRILGEDQIITQVGDALGKARENFATDHVLEVLFRQAVTAGKKVKTNVSLSTADRSVIHQAIYALGRQGYDFTGKRVMVIGNGMMGKLAAEALREAGCCVTVTVRQYHSGVVQIPEGCARINYAERYELLPACDLVVSATSSPNYTITRSELEKLSLSEEVLLIDLAVPRDIEADCGDIPGMRLFDIDSFEVDLRSDRLLENIRRAEAIIEEEKETFEDYYTGRDVLPKIARLKVAAAEDISARMKTYLRKSELSETEKQEIKIQVEGAAQRMMNKLLFDMRDEMDTLAYRECLSAMEKILG